MMRSAPWPMQLDQLPPRSARAPSLLPSLVAMAEPKAPLLMKLRASGLPRSTLSVTTTTRQAFRSSADDQRLGQEDHRETLSARRVPDDAAPPTIRPALLDTFEQGTDAEKLLVTRHHLADLAVEQHKKARNSSSRAGVSKATSSRSCSVGKIVCAHEYSKCWRNFAGLSTNSAAVVAADGAGSSHSASWTSLEFLFPPARPELRRRRSCRSAPRYGSPPAATGRRRKAAEVVMPAVTQILANSLVDRRLLGLAAHQGAASLRHRQRQAGDVPSQYVSCVDAIINAQNKNADALTNRPYIGMYHDFYRAFLALFYAGSTWLKHIHSSNCLVRVLRLQK